VIKDNDMKTWVSGGLEVRPYAFLATKLNEGDNDPII
jgi:hypothetical protein